MKDRYFSDTPITGTSVTLQGNEAHHLLHVMRAKPGTELTVFDGQGGEWSAVVVRLGRTEVELALGEHDPIERETAFEITLAVPLPKGDRQRWLIEKAVELGVARLLPLTTERSTKSAAEAPAKLTRYVIEASKQCGRNCLMQIEQPQSWPELAASVIAPSRILAHPGSKPLSEIKSTGPVLIAIGPEGGFTDGEEAEAVENGWQVVGLGERILRIETAALALVSLWGIR
ncbi:RsmE family RNA methyltransferase [Bythopirellula polymerisocia]|uniref:Ribosomal RNA small subunit methyltransferase E n=1 Tax=Bythopirellula polymerisocia TaxID=2528003 RepID=A0A5C6D2N0_9BACT|nr:RsmE family RNA methyltransferase [Bythopirellula polymerisocia]TWU30041.1 Ribosomal RNA small subunit methyltransferase E [Bythopirellula polymerisocia]